MIRWRLYFDKDKEEKWINQLADRGQAMEKYFVGFYLFKECRPGEYHYQIDLLNKEKSGMNAEEYISFVEETGAEFVDRWFFWVFFRKRAGQGEFNLYSDRESQIGQYKRIYRFMRGFALLETILLLIEVFCSLWLLLANGELSKSSVFYCILMAVTAAGFWYMLFMIKRKIKKLNEQI